MDEAPTTLVTQQAIGILGEDAVLSVAATITEAHVGILPVQKLHVHCLETTDDKTAAASCTHSTICLESAADEARSGAGPERWSRQPRRHGWRGDPTYFTDGHLIDPAASVGRDDAGRARLPPWVLLGSRRVSGPHGPREGIDWSLLQVGG